MTRFAVGRACKVSAVLDQGGAGELLRNTRGITATVVRDRNAFAARKMHRTGAQNGPKKVDEYRCSSGRKGVEPKPQPPRLHSHADFPAANAWRSIGSFRKRTPVATNSALASAGAAAAVPGSPMPPGASTL